MYKLDRNEQFSEMSITDKKELLNFLKHYHIEYRHEIGLNPDMTFGIEIECSIPGKIIYPYKHKKHTTFSPCEECSVGKNGWEFKSSILYDNVETWKEVKRTCDYLKDISNINENCGGHIHFGAHVFKDNYKNFMNLILLWMAYEDIIYRFGNGDSLNTRVVARKYTAPIVNVFKSRFIEFGYPNNLEQFLKLINSQDQELGLNFFNYSQYYNKKTQDKNTIEVRCPNGTLEEVIWQNNINFFGRLIQTALNEDLDLVKLCYYISGNSYGDNCILDEYGKLNLDKALELADLVYDNNCNKIDFLKQYIKNGKTANSLSLVKTKKFWK